MTAKWMNPNSKAVIAWVTEAEDDGVATDVWWATSRQRVDWLLDHADVPICIEEHLDHKGSWIDLDTFWGLFKCRRQHYPPHQFEPETYWRDMTCRR